MSKMMQSGQDIKAPEFSEPIAMAQGGRVYPQMQHGGAVQSRPYMVGEQGPELFMPDTSGDIIPNNKLGGGITINIEGDVYDADNFAETVSEVLPDALRNADLGGHSLRTLQFSGRRRMIN